MGAWSKHFHDPSFFTISFSKTRICKPTELSSPSHSHLLKWIQSGMIGATQTPRRSPLSIKHRART